VARRVKEDEVAKFPAAAAPDLLPEELFLSGLELSRFSLFAAVDMFVIQNLSTKQKGRPNFSLP
jgi:hypothetical protein